MHGALGRCPVVQVTAEGAGMALSVSWCPGVPAIPFMRWRCKGSAQIPLS